MRGEGIGQLLLGNLPPVLESQKFANFMFSDDFNTPDVSGFFAFFVVFWGFFLFVCLFFLAPHLEVYSEVPRLGVESEL